MLERAELAELAEKVDNIMRHENVVALELVPDMVFPTNECYALSEGVLGIRLKALYKCYVAMFKAGTQFTDSALLVTTLAAPENITAWNRRKDNCLNGVFDIKHEWKLVHILLKSHTEKVCKSPITWYHRQWLLTNFPAVCTTSLQAEFELVKTATENHRCNYAAWRYMRWYYTNYSGISVTDTRSMASSAARTEIITLMKPVCKQNVSDSSVWSFAFWLQSIELKELAIEMDKAFPDHEAIKLLLKRYNPPTPFS